MTDRAGVATRPRRSSGLAVAWVAAAAFLALLLVLAIRLREGHDPALGRGWAKAPARRVVVVRRIVNRRVIVTVVPAPGSASAPGTPASAAPTAQVTSAPAVTPAASAPAPVTRTS